MKIEILARGEAKLASGDLAGKRRLPIDQSRTVEGLDVAAQRPLGDEHAIEADGAAQRDLVGMPGPEVTERRIVMAKEFGAGLAGENDVGVIGDDVVSSTLEIVEIPLAKFASHFSRDVVELVVAIEIVGGAEAGSANGALKSAVFRATVDRLAMEAVAGKNSKKIGQSVFFFMRI